MAATAPAITAIAPWYGSKRKLAPRIVAELGPHTFFFDAFCGSLAVLLAKDRSPMEMVCDLNGDLVNMVRVMQCPLVGPKFYRSARRMICSQQLWREAADKCRPRAMAAAPRGPDLESALEFFLYSWLGRNGVIGSDGWNNFCARYTANGGSPAKRLASAVESIPAWRQRLREVIVLNEDAFSVLDRLDDSPSTAIYCDPPYVVKGAKYLHDFADGDHAKLATNLKKFRQARIVVSYYDHPSLRKLYDGWTVVDCTTTKSMVSAGKRDQRGATKAPEILLINGPSYTAGGELF